MRRIYVGLLSLFTVFALSSEHKVKLEIKQIQWNTIQRNYQTPVKISAGFVEKSDLFLLDTLGKDTLFVRFSAQPVYYDYGFEYGFLMEIFSSGKQGLKLETKTRYKKGSYEAGATGTSVNGVRKWTGELRYTPDTSIKHKSQAWRSDRFTLRIDRIETWRPKSEKSIMLKWYTVEGTTGSKPQLRKLGKIEKEKISLSCEAIRYQWGKEVWMDIVLKWYVEKDDKQTEFLAYTIRSNDKNVLAINRDIQNKYLIKGTLGSKAMLTYVKLIPY